jgi:hypothetical protein
MFSAKKLIANLRPQIGVGSYQAEWAYELIANTAYAQALQDLTLATAEAGDETIARLLRHALSDQEARALADQIIILRAAVRGHDARVSELLEANNREVERRRAAEAALRQLRGD